MVENRLFQKALKHTEQQNMTLQKDFIVYLYMVNAWPAHPIQQAERFGLKDKVGINILLKYY